MSVITHKDGVFYGGSNFPIPSHMNFGRMVVDKLLQHKNKVALINGSTGESISYTDLAKKIVNVATSLSKLGVRQGDVVAICSENRIEYLIANIATYYLGAVSTFLNIAYTKDELIHTSNISKPKFAFLSPDAQKLHFDTLKNHTTITKFIVFGDVATTEIGFDKLTLDDPNGSVFPADFYGQAQTALILYSSGTTGLPKGAKITHLNLIVTVFQSSTQPDVSKSLLTVAPWCNTMGIMTLTDALMLGKTVVFLRRFDESLYLQVIEKYKVGELLIAPPVLIILSKSPRISKYDLSSVVLIHSGGAPLDSDVITLVKSKFPNLRNVTQGYGMTETTGSITRELDSAPKQGSVGFISEGIIVKVVDVETRKALGPNERGEICVKGLVLFNGYIGKERGDDYDDDGFFKTGDIGYYDEEGFFFIVDRIKELIKYKAWQVSPAELEAVVLLHEAVKDVGVIGTPDPTAGELPTAFVVKKPGSNVSEKDIIEFVNTKVSPWKRLRGGVKFIEEIPKTGSGKILRRKLRELIPKKVASKL
ncbi:uncharacterized protein LOC135071999 [Ostrinia nubilalis]|uniref:uncharacterized protein LOC135071999 n=1 Tax=Ostrinia nubilalis TaxID=29057 RepID=UPI003082459B